MTGDRPRRRPPVAAGSANRAPASPRAVNAGSQVGNPLRGSFRWYSLALEAGYRMADDPVERLFRKEATRNRAALDQNPAGRVEGFGVGAGGGLPAGVGSALMSDVGNGVDGMSRRDDGNPHGRPEHAAGAVDRDDAAGALSDRDDISHRQIIDAVGEPELRRHVGCLLLPVAHSVYQADVLSPQAGHPPGHGARTILSPAGLRQLCRQRANAVGSAHPNRAGAEAGNRGRSTARSATADARLRPVFRCVTTACGSSPSPRRADARGGVPPNVGAPGRLCDRDR